jgi:hydrogenase-4 component F
VSVIILLILPLLAALLSGAGSARTRLARRTLPPTPYPLHPAALTLAACLAVLILAARLALRVAQGKPVVVSPKWIAVDGLSALILLLIAFVGATAAFYSMGYLSRSTEPGKLRLYYANYNLFMFSMLAIPMLVEPTLTWIVVELTTVCSAMLVCFENTRAALEAAWKYVVLSLMGAAVALFGFLLLFAAMRAGGGGTYTWEGLIAAAPRMPPLLLQTAFVLILVGLGTKVGLVPMHTWLPDAHSQAPSPVCALLSGVETTAVLYVILRLMPVLKAAPGSHVEMWTMLFGLISVGTAAFLLLQVRDYKRMFAFSTVEHMGIILMAAGLGSSAAHYGALYQALSHTLTKSFCFFAAGAALLAAGNREIAAVRGLIRTSPAAGASLLLGGLAIAGAPPFALFLSEFSIFKAGLAEGRYLAIGLLVLFIAIGFFGILFHVNRMVFGPAAGRSSAELPLGGSDLGYPRSGWIGATSARLPVPCVATLWVAGSLVIVFGLYLPAPLHELLRLGAAALAR